MTLTRSRRKTMGSPGSGYFELLLAQSRPNYVIPKRNVQCHLMAARSHPSSVVSYRPSTAGKRTVLLGQTRRSTPSHSCDRSVDGRQSLRPAKSTECPRPVYDTGIGPKARDSAERDAVNATAGVVSCSPELTSPRGAPAIASACPPFGRVLGPMRHRPSALYCCDGLSPWIR